MINLNIKIEKMKKAGKKVADLHDLLRNFIKPGISTQDIDEFCRLKMIEMNCISGAKGYQGFPKHVCTSINNVICHGVPNEREILKNGDMISVDIAMSFEGYFGDSCVNYLIGEVSEEKKHLSQVGYEAMWNAISIIKNGISTLELGRMMRKTAEKYGFSTTEDFCGHGIGQKMHDSPLVPFYPEPMYNKKLKTGDFITIEPMVTKYSEAHIKEDGWTALTRAGEDAVQFEHTILILENGYEVMTFNGLDEEMGKIKKSGEFLNSC